MPTTRRTWFGIVLLLCTVAPVPATAGTVTVAATSDLVLAMDTIATEFNHRTGHTVKVSYGSSGNFAREIVRGGPYELFFSANFQYVDLLVRHGLTLEAGIPYAIGHLTLFLPKDSRVALLSDLSDLGPAVADGRLQKIAIANPEHAPYGQAAKQALERAGIWPLIMPRLVNAENSAQAAQFASIGAVDAALIPLALTNSDKIRATGTHVEVDSSLYTPPRQYMVLLKQAGGPALEFYNFMRESGTRDILARFGFGLP